MKNLDDKKIKRTHWFLLFIDKIQLCTLILLEINIFHKKYQAKAKINLSLKIYLEYKIMILFCVDFIVFLS